MAMSAQVKPEMPAPITMRSKGGEVGVVVAAQEVILREAMVDEGDTRKPKSAIVRGSMQYTQKAKV